MPKQTVASSFDLFVPTISHCFSLEDACWGPACEVEASLSVSRVPSAFRLGTEAQLDAESAHWSRFATRQIRCRFAGRISSSCLIVEEEDNMSEIESENEGTVEENEGKN